MNKILFRISSILTLIVFLGHTYAHFTWKKDIPTDQIDMLTLVSTMERTYLPMPGPIQHSVGQVMDGYSIMMSLFFLILGKLLWVTSTESGGRIGMIQFLLFFGISVSAYIAWTSFFIIPSVFLTVSAVLTGFVLLKEKMKG